MPKLHIINSKRSRFSQRNNCPGSQVDTLELMSFGDYPKPILESSLLSTLPKRPGVVAGLLIGAEIIIVIFTFLRKE